MEDLSPQSKADVRARLRSAGHLPAGESLRASQSIRSRVEALEEVRRADVVLGFLPLPDEPDLSGLLEQAIRMGRRVAIPAINWQTRQMWAVEVHDLDSDVQVTRHGVREPRSSTTIAADGIDVVLVPGLAFDTQGVRLGRGGGFYDRFLADPALRALKVGVAFDRQVVGRLPRDPHDVAMDVVVTDHRVIRA